MEPYFAFQWHITDSCDQRCQHCYIFSENHAISLQEMSYQEIKSVLANCQEMCSKLQRTPYFYITGGDPILHKNFWELLELLKSHAIAFSILGNPFHLSEEVCQKLKYYGCERYQLSIDGLRDTHDRIRKPGSFDTTIEKIPCIRTAGIKAVVMTTVSNTNIKEIPAIIDLMVEKQIDVFAFARYCPTSLEKSTHIAPQEYKEFLQLCWRKFENYKEAETTFHLKDHLWTLFLYEQGLFSIPERLEEEMIYDGCNCGNSHLTILPNGDVYACRRFESRVGNVYKDQLYDVFLGKNMDSYRQYHRFEKCSACELLRFCRGCPAVAYGYSHDFYAADPQCWKEVSRA